MRSSKVTAIRTFASFSRGGRGEKEGRLHSCPRVALRKLSEISLFFSNNSTHISSSLFAYFTISCLCFHALLYIFVFTREPRVDYARARMPNICWFYSRPRTLLNFVQEEREVKFLPREYIYFRLDSFNYLILFIRF